MKNTNNVFDWKKLALEVNDERKKAITRGIKAAHAFNEAFRVVMRQYPSITGETWVEARAKIGTILSGWRKAKKEAAPTSTKKAKSTAPKKKPVAMPPTQGKFPF